MAFLFPKTKHARELVKHIGLEFGKHRKHIGTPMSTTLKLTKDPTGKSVDPSLYRSMIGSLLYLTAGRPDIAFSVGACAGYQLDPKESHLTSVKRIIRCVRDI